MIIFRVRERQEIVAFHKRIFTAIADRKKTHAVDALTELATYTRGRLAAAIERRG